MEQIIITIMELVTVVAQVDHHQIVEDLQMEILEVVAIRPREV
ncbi:hypothetical protein [Methanobrevibacter arboriphilus]|nr:hypothetical protein [Methanobrevibacter arboriphilus]